MKKITHCLKITVVCAVLLLPVKYGSAQEQAIRAGSAGASELLINPFGRSSGWGSANIAGVTGLESQYSNIAGLAQNNFINGDTDEAAVKFQRVLDDYKKSNGALQSSIYLLSDALRDGDNEKLIEILSRITSDLNNIDDPILKSYIFKVKGDILLDQNDISDAIENYKLASKYAERSSNKVKYDIATSSALLMAEEYRVAVQLLEEVLSVKDINFNDKNKAAVPFAQATAYLDLVIFFIEFSNFFL